MEYLVQQIAKDTVIVCNNLNNVVLTQKQTDSEKKIEKMKENRKKKEHLRVQLTVRTAFQKSGKLFIKWY